MRGMVLAGAMAMLLAVSTDAQERPRPQGNDGRGRGMTGRVHPRASGWYGGSGYGGSGYGGYFRLDGGGWPYGVAAGGYGAYSQGYAYGAYGNGGWDSEDGDWVMPEYYSLNPGRFQRSWRGYYVLPPNFAEDEAKAEAEAEARPKTER